MLRLARHIASPPLTGQTPNSESFTYRTSQYHLFHFVSRTYRHTRRRRDVIEPISCSRCRRCSLPSQYRNTLSRYTCQRQVGAYAGDAVTAHSMSNAFIGYFDSHHMSGAYSARGVISGCCACDAILQKAAFKHKAKNSSTSCLIRI